MALGRTLALTAAIVAAALARAQDPQKQDATTVPFDLRTTRPILDVFINGDGPFKFVLDTGASQTMVSADLAERLQLPNIGTVMLGAPNSDSAVRAPLHRIRELRVGELKFFGLKAVGLLDRSFTQTIHADGIISGEDFTGYLLTLDYRKRQLVIAPGRLPEADGQQVLDYQMKFGIPGIEFDVMGKKTFFHLDSGSPFFIALPGSMLTTLEYERKPQLAASAGTVAGNFLVYSGRLAGDVKFGKYVLNKPEVEILDKMPYGNLGYRFFRDYLVTFDYNAMRVKLTFWRDALEKSRG